MENDNQVFWRTDCLVLRRFSMDDTNYFHFYRSNPEVAKFQSWVNYQYHEAKTFVNEQVKIILIYQVLGSSSQLL